VVGGVLERYGLQDDSGRVVTSLYGFCQQSPCPDGSLPIAALVLGSDGKLYGTDEGGGTSSGGKHFQDQHGRRSDHAA
jgi:hypothetical protein